MVYSIYNPYCTTFVCLGNFSYLYQHIKVLVREVREEVGEILD